MTIPLPPYPTNRYADDQNYYALQFLECGNMLGRMLAMTMAKKAFKEIDGMVPELRSSIEILASASPMSRIRTAGQSMLAELGNVYEEAAAAKKFKPALIKSIIDAGEGQATILHSDIEYGPPQELGCLWFVPGVKAGLLDEVWTTDGESKIYKSMMKDLLTGLEYAGINRKHKLRKGLSGSVPNAFGLIHGWLFSQTNTLWKADFLNAEYSFNGQNLTEAQFKVLCAIYNCDAKKGFTQSQLRKESDCDSAHNILGVLRRMKKVMGFISAKGAARWIKPCPPPPSINTGTDSRPNP